MFKTLEEAIAFLKQYVFAADLGGLLAAKHMPDFDEKKEAARKMVEAEYRRRHFKKIYDRPASYKLEDGTIVDCSVNHMYPEPPLMLGDEGLQAMIDSLEGKEVDLLKKMRLNAEVPFTAPDSTPLYSPKAHETLTAAVRNTSGYDINRSVGETDLRPSALTAAYSGGKVTDRNEFIIDTNSTIHDFCKHHDAKVGWEEMQTTLANGYAKQVKLAPKFIGQVRKSLEDDQWLKGMVWGSIGLDREADILFHAFGMRKIMPGRKRTIRVFSVLDREELIGSDLVAARDYAESRGWKNIVICYADSREEEIVLFNLPRFFVKNKQGLKGHFLRTADLG